MVLFFHRRDKSKKRKKKRHRRRRVFFVLVFLCFLLLLVWALFPLKERFEQQRKIRELNSKISKLRWKNRNLREEIRKLNSPEYIELLARKDLGLIKPGEEAYIVAQVEKKEETEVTDPQQEEKENTLWGEISHFFSDIF